MLTLVCLPAVALAPLIPGRLRGRLTARTGLEAPLVYVLLATSVATLPITDWELGLPKVLGMALGAATLVAVGTALSSIASLKWAMWIVAALALAVSGAGLVGVEWIQGKFPLLDPLYSHLPGLIRGVVPNTKTGGIQPNELAGALVMIIPVLLAQSLAARISWRSAFAGLAGLIALGVLVLTQSRSGIAGVGVALALLSGIVAFRVARSKTLPYLVRISGPIAWLSGVTFAGWLGWQMMLRWITPVGDSLVLNTLEGRQELWDRAGYMIQDFAFTGIGLGQFSPVLHALYVPFLVAPDTFVPHAHNIFLEYALELGIPGAVAFGLLVRAFFRQCWKAAHCADPMIRWAALGLALGVVGFMVYGLTDTIAPGARAGLILWVVLGLGGAVGNLAAHSPAASYPTLSGGIS